MAQAKNLFNDDITILKDAVYFGANLQWKQVQSSVLQAERTWIRTTFGDYYTDLLTKIGDDTLDANDTNLLTELRLAAGNLTWWIYADQHNVSITSTGFHQTHGQDQKPAFAWAVNNVKESFRKKGFDAIENTFDFLESNSAIYNFDESSVRKASRSCLLATAQEFQEEVDIMRSRYVYLQLIPEMKRIQRDVIAPLVGIDAFNVIIKKLQKDNDNDNDLTELEQSIVDIAKPFLAYKTMASSVSKRTIEFNEIGLLVHNSSFAGIVEGRQPADMDRIQAYQNEWTLQAQAKLSDLDKLINPEEEKTQEEIDSINTLEPDNKIGGFY